MMQTDNNKQNENELLIKRLQIDKVKTIEYDEETLSCSEPGIQISSERFK